MRPWIIVALAAAPLSEMQDAAWKHVADRTTDVGTISVSRQRVGHLDCWQATTTVAVRPKSLLDVATNLEGAERWTDAHLVWSRVIERGEAHVVYAQYMEPPAATLSRPRYWVARGEISRAGEGWRMRWHRLESAGHVPAPTRRVADDAIEIPVNTGEWLFAPGPAGTRVRYRVCTDPGGTLPDWVQRLATRSTLPNNVASIVREAMRREGP